MGNPFAWSPGARYQQAESGAAQETKQLVKAPPNGKEKYLGNGHHEWEDVVAGDVRRLRVPGGWIYETTANAVFVPIPEVVGYRV